MKIEDFADSEDDVFYVSLKSRVQCYNKTSKLLAVINIPDQTIKPINYFHFGSNASSDMLVTDSTVTSISNSYGRISYRIDGTKLYYKLEKIACGSTGNTELSCWKSLSTPTTAPDYCASSGNNTNYEYIDRVIFGNIDNVSGSEGGYGDFTNQIATVGLNDNVPLGLSPGFLGSPYNETWRVWIDFNQDGDFREFNELVYSGSGAGSLAHNVYIPGDAELGLTGMRVSMRWNMFPSWCSNYAFGEVEDYTVNITAESQNFPPLDLRSDNYVVENPAMRIFPNPTTEHINVSFQNIREGGSIAIYSTSGQLISTHNIDAEHLQVSLRQLPAGLYILHLKYGGEIYASERFVKLSK